MIGSLALFLVGVLALIGAFALVVLYALLWGPWPDQETIDTWLMTR